MLLYAAQALKCSYKYGPLRVEREKILSIALYGICCLSLSGALLLLPTKSPLRKNLCNDIFTGEPKSVFQTTSNWIITATGMKKRTGKNTPIRIISTGRKRSAYR